jgi:hypothetical protein
MGVSPGRDGEVGIGRESVAPGAEQIDGTVVVRISGRGTRLPIRGRGTRHAQWHLWTGVHKFRGEII